MLLDHALKIKAAATALVAALSAIWGWFGWLVILWIALMVLDYCTGSMAAAKDGTWKSKAARDGIWNKAGAIAVVMVAAATDMLLQTVTTHLPAMNLEYTVLLCPIVVVWYCITELGSNIENAVRLGAPVPPLLENALEILKKKTGQEKSDEN